MDDEPDAAGKAEEGRSARLIENQQPAEDGDKCKPCPLDRPSEHVAGHEDRHEQGDCREPRAGQTGWPGFK